MNPAGAVFHRLPGLPPDTDATCNYVVIWRSEDAKTTFCATPQLRERETGRRQPLPRSAQRASPLPDLNPITLQSFASADVGSVFDCLNEEANSSRRTGSNSPHFERRIDSLCQCR